MARPLHVVYVEQSPLDLFLEQEEGREEELGFERLVERARDKNTPDCDIAIQLVDKWRKEFKIFIPCQLRTVSIPGADVDEKFFNREHWNEELKSETYRIEFWIKKRKELSLSQYIPEDPIDRMVLCFLCDWLRPLFYDYIVDANVPESERLALLRHQVENFVFHSRTKPFGGQWKFNSEPNILLQEALRDLQLCESDDTSESVAAQEDRPSNINVMEGTELVLSDSSDSSSSGNSTAVGSHSTSISGFRISAKADKSIPKTAGDGPKLDDLDKYIYREVTTYAANKLENDVPKSWTMVRGSFIDHSKKKDVRCYAFSGYAKSGRKLDDMPVEWFRENNFSCPNKLVHITGVDRLQFAHNMVLVLFSVLRPFIVNDLSRLAQHRAFAELKDVEGLILKARQDMRVLHYGYFYDSVVDLLNSYDKKIKKAVKKQLSKLGLESTTAKKLLGSHDIWESISVGANNKKYEPNDAKLCQKLCEIFGEENGSKISVIMHSISQKLLSELQGRIECLPNDYLDKLFSQLKQTHCAEDNAIGSVLRQLLLLNSNDAFLNICVNFAALDAHHKADDVKPFCPVCSVKVMFYSALPMLLRSIGCRVNDFDKLALLFAKLKVSL